MSKKINLRIWRGDVNSGKLEDVSVEANEGEVVLDVSTACKLLKWVTWRLDGIAKPVSVVHVQWR